MGQVLMSLESVRRVAEVRSKGGFVEVIKPKESVFMTTKITKDEPKKPASNPNTVYYDKDGKDIANTGLAKPVASGRSVRTSIIHSSYLMPLPLNIALVKIHTATCLNAGLLRIQHTSRHIVDNCI